jgi:hypothetical protein
MPSAKVHGRSARRLVIQFQRDLLQREFTATAAGSRSDAYDNAMAEEWIRVNLGDGCS